MSDDNKFLGVVCSCVDGRSEFKSLINIIDATKQSVHNNIKCHDLILSNKYYKATVQLFDYSELPPEQSTAQLLNDCHAIILFGDGETLTEEQLDAKRKQLANAGGDPRILLCWSINEESSACEKLRDWCVKRGYELLSAAHEDVREQLIESLSAYKWVQTPNLTSTDCLIKGTRTESNDVERIDDTDRPIENELLKKMMDFDNLLQKLSAYRDNPDVRGNPDDKNIEEIAELLSGLLGDENDNFLAESDDSSLE